MTANKIILTLNDARQIVAGAEAEAQKNNWPVVIAVVDDGGHLILLHRLDGAQYGSVNVAIEKARAAIAFRRPTKVWEENVARGEMRYLKLPGVLPIEGGVPAIVNQQYVGAVGVSGVRSFEDTQITQAGINALTV